MAPGIVSAPQVVRELSSHTGFPPTQIFETTSSGPRRSTRPRQPTSKASVETSTPDSTPAPAAGKPALKEPNGKVTKRSKRAASMTARRTSNKDRKTAAIKASESDKSETESADTLPASPLQAEPITDVAEMMGKAARLRPKPFCRRCPDMMRCEHQLISSKCGKTRWWVGPVGILEIGGLRWPCPEKSVTYVWNGGQTTTFEREGSEDGDTEVEEDGGGEGEEDGQRIERVQEQIREWRVFCRYGRHFHWGTWLDEWRRPEHICRRTWNLIEKRKKDAINAEYDERIKKTKSWVGAVQ